MTPAAGSLPQSGSGRLLRGKSLGAARGRIRLFPGPATTLTRGHLAPGRTAAVGDCCRAKATQWTAAMRKLRSFLDRTAGGSARLCCRRRGAARSAQGEPDLTTQTAAHAYFDSSPQATLAPGEYRPSVGSARAPRPPSPPVARSIRRTVGPGASHPSAGRADGVGGSS